MEPLIYDFFPTFYFEKFQTYSNFWKTITSVTLHLDSTTVNILPHSLFFLFHSVTNEPFEVNCAHYDISTRNIF